MGAEVNSRRAVSSTASMLRFFSALAAALAATAAAQGQRQKAQRVREQLGQAVKAHGGQRGTLAGHQEQEGAAALWPGRRATPFVSKRRAAPFVPGRRVADWQVKKMKTMEGAVAHGPR